MSLIVEKQIESFEGTFELREGTMRLTLKSM